MSGIVRVPKKKHAAKGIFGLLPDWKIDTQAFRDEESSRLSADNPSKKNAARHLKMDKQPKDTLSGFLENEPDLYSISDLKVRYK